MGLTSLSLYELSEFVVQCFHCKGAKGRTIKKKGKVWAFCPNCGAGLDVMNEVRSKKK